MRVDRRRLYLIIITISVMAVIKFKFGFQILGKPYLHPRRAQSESSELRLRSNQSELPQLQLRATQSESSELRLRSNQAESLESKLRSTQSESPEFVLRPIKLHGIDIYVYSAVAVPAKDGKTDIRIQAIKKVKDEKTLICCFENKDGEDLKVTAKDLYGYRYPGLEYHSTGFSCLIDSQDVPQSVSLTHSNCRIKNKTKLEISPPEKPKGSISVCVHATYGHPDPEMIVEWMEFIKLQGVERVFVSPVNHKNFLDQRVWRVLEYYKNQGLVRLIPYELKPTTNNKNWYKRGPEVWSDKILPVFDCMVRSSLYKYSAFIDFDEIIMFRSNPLDLVGNLDKLVKQSPKSGVFVFKMEIFMLNWTATYNSDLIFMKYINRTEGLKDRQKLVYIQGRYAYISPHDAFPAAGYERVVVPDLTGAIHHYRSCRVDWSDKFCLTTPRYRDDAMLEFESIMNEKLKKVPQNLRKETNV